MGRRVQKYPSIFTAEGKHRLRLWLLRRVGASNAGRWLLSNFYRYDDPVLEREIFGVSFPNPIGISAGFDVDGRLYRQLKALGWGFVEIGTLTPKPQNGNARPRLFRLKADRALINRIGFENGGLEQALYNLRRRGERPAERVGANIAKNTLTDLDGTVRDYLKMFRNLYQYVDYFTLNVEPLIEQVTMEGGDVKSMLLAVMDALVDFRRGQTDYCPILMKVSPDWDKALVDSIIEVLVETQLDGLVVGGATYNHEGLKSSPRRLRKVGEGGLSGEPLFPYTVELLKYVKSRLPGHYPLIASGGVMKPEDVQTLLDAGADLVQIYTGLIYNGAGFAKKICQHLAMIAHHRKGTISPCIK